MNSNIRDKWSGMNHMDLILEGDEGRGRVYLGNIESARSVDKLVDNDIHAVLTVAEGTGLNYLGGTGPNKVAFHLILKCQDNQTQDMSELIPAGVQFIHHKRHFTNVLVHCFAGVSRSASVLICYLIQHHNLCYQQALSLLQAKRPCVMPNPSFLDQIQIFEKMHLRQSYYIKQITEPDDQEYEYQIEQQQKQEIEYK